MPKFDLQNAILKEHSSKQASLIADWALLSDEKLEELIEIFMHGDFKTTQRAGYAILKTFDISPKAFDPYLIPLFEYMIGEGSQKHVAVRRNIFRMFEVSAIPKEIEGKLFQVCIDFLENKSETDAIRSSAIIVGFRIAKPFPELCAELKLLVEAELPYAKPSFRARYKRAMKSKK